MNTNTNTNTTLVLALALGLGACGSEITTPANGCGRPANLPANFWWAEHCDVPDFFFDGDVEPGEPTTLFVPHTRPWIHLEVGCPVRVESELRHDTVPTATMGFTLILEGAPSVVVPPGGSMGWIEVPDNGQGVMQASIRADSGDWISVHAYDKITSSPAEIEHETCPL